MTDQTETLDIALFYPADIALKERTPAWMWREFMAYMDELDHLNANSSTGYVGGALAECTGLECWFTYFIDGVSFEDAWQEDQSYD